MLPVALEMQADAIHMQFETMRASVASLFDKKGQVAKDFRKSIDAMRQKKKPVEGSRDGDPAEDFLKAMAGGLGMKVPISRKRK